MADRDADVDRLLDLAFGLAEEGEPGPDAVEVLLSQPDISVETLREVARRADALEHSAKHDHVGAHVLLEAAVLKLEARATGGATTDPHAW